MQKIESLDYYGRGITKVNNKITFVENALPNELVELNVYKEKKKFNEASVIKYIEKSNDRSLVKCPYYDFCGGCNIMHLDYDNQLKFKENKIKDIIYRNLDSNIKINNIVRSDKQYNYRNKVTFQVNKNIGFYKNNSYELINIDNCLISDNIINNSLKYLKKLNLNRVNKITCRLGNKLMLIIETSDNNLNIDCIKDIAECIYLKVGDNYIHVYGKENIYEKIDNYKYIISPDSFFQVNINICNKLYRKIKEYVGTDKNVLDLYCGTGSIGIYVSNNNRVIGIEKNRYAIKDANINKKTNNIDNIDFICGDSGKKLRDLDFLPDIIIVDPPRSGLNKETIDNILKFNSDKIIYVSCNPMTLVRDLKVLNKYYDIKEITPFDMFPNTYHVECVCLLKLK